jgi:pyridoxal phosphate enzyme (YggS family)
VTAFTEHLAHLQARIARAAAAAGRPAGSVTLVAVSKGHPAETVRTAVAAGLRHFGENYLQEALPKIQVAGQEPVWHFIGRLQANKTRPVAQNFAWVQSVDSLRLARRLAEQRSFHGEPLQVLLQLKPGHAADRGGCPGEELPALAAAVEDLPRLRLRGLMFMPAAGLEPGALAAEYARAAAAFDELRRRGHDLDTLSMGMSDDLEAAIAAGSTMIRVGTALFGPRSGHEGGAGITGAGEGNEHG